MDRIRGGREGRGLLDCCGARPLRLAILSIFLIIYGITIVLFGSAILLGDGYPNWFGWGMLVLGRLDGARSAPGYRG